MGRQILLIVSSLALTSVAHAGDQILLADVNPHRTNTPNEWDYSEHGPEKGGARSRVCTRNRWRFPVAGRH